MMFHDSTSFRFAQRSHLKSFPYTTHSSMPAIDAQHGHYTNTQTIIIIIMKQTERNKILFLYQFFFERRQFQSLFVVGARAFVVYPKIFHKSINYSSKGSDYHPELIDSEADC